MVPDSETEMTKAFTQTHATRLPTLPDGWPISSTVGRSALTTPTKRRNRLSIIWPRTTSRFGGVTIVGIDPMLVERVDAHLTWRRVLATGAMSGVWLGLFVGLLLSLFATGVSLLPIMIGLIAGVVFGLASAALRHASARGRRNFVSHSQLVARRYDLLSHPHRRTGPGAALSAHPT